MNSVLDIIRKTIRGQQPLRPYAKEKEEGEFKRFSPIPEDYKFQTETSRRGDPEAPLVEPSEFAKFSKLRTGGQYTIDPTVEGDIKYKSVSLYSPSRLREARQNLSSTMWEIDHKIPLWAGGTDTNENKVKLTVAQHERKTKIEAVTRTLYYDNDYSRSNNFTKANARVMNALALGRDDVDLDEIKVDDNGYLVTESGDPQEAVAFAIKKKLEWEGERNYKVGFKEVWDEIKDTSLLGRFGKSTISGFTGSWISPEQTKPEEGKELESKVTEALGHITGTIASFVALEGVATQVLGRAGILVRAKKIASGSKYLKGSGDIVEAGGISLSRNTAIKALKNAGLFGLQGQLSRQESNEFSSRIKRLVTDATMGSMLALPGVTKTPSDFIKNYGGLFAGSYTFSKIEGASTEDAIIGSTILVGLHGLGEKARIKSLELRGDSFSKTWRNKYLPEEMRMEPLGKYTEKDIIRQNFEINKWIGEVRRVNPGLTASQINEFKTKMVVTGRQIYKGGLSQEKRLIEDYNDTVSLIRRERVVETTRRPEDGITKETAEIFEKYLDKMEVPRDMTMEEAQVLKLVEIKKDVKPMKIILTGTGLEDMGKVIKEYKKEGGNPGDTVYLVKEKNKAEIYYIEEYYAREGKDIMSTMNNPSDIVRVFANVGGKIKQIGVLPTSAKSGYTTGKTSKTISIAGYDKRNINENMRLRDWGEKEVPQNVEGINNTVIKQMMDNAGVDIIPARIDFITAAAANSKKASITINIEPKDFVAALRRGDIKKTATERLRDLPRREGTFLFTEPLDRLIEAISTKDIKKVQYLFDQMFGGSKLSDKNAKLLIKEDSTIGTYADIITTMSKKGKLTDTGQSFFVLTNEYLKVLKKSGVYEKVKDFNLLGGKSAETIAKTMADRKARADEPARLRETSGEDVPIMDLPEYNIGRKEPLSSAIEGVEVVGKSLKTGQLETVKEAMHAVKIEKVKKENIEGSVKKVEIEKEVHKAKEVDKKEEAISKIEKIERRKTWTENVAVKKGEEGIPTKVLEYIGDVKPVEARQFNNKNLTKMANKASKNREDIAGGWKIFLKDIETRLGKIRGEKDFKITDKRELNDLNAKYRKVANSTRETELNRVGAPKDGSLEQIGRYNDDLSSFCKRNGLEKNETYLVRTAKDVEYGFKESDSRVKFETNNDTFNDLGRLSAIQGKDKSKPFIRFRVGEKKVAYYDKATGEEFIADFGAVVRFKDKKTNKHEIIKDEKIEISDTAIDESRVLAYMPVGITSKGVENVVYFKYSKKIADLFKKEMLNDVDPVTGRREILPSNEDKFLRVIMTKALGLSKDTTNVDFVKRANLIYNRYDKNFSAEAKMAIPLNILTSRKFKDMKKEDAPFFGIEAEMFIEPSSLSVKKTMADFPNGSVVDGMFVSGNKLFDKIVKDFNLDPSRNRNSLKVMINTEAMIDGVKVKVVHKGLVIKEDPALRNMVESVYGEKIDPMGLTSFNTNAKLGPKEGKVSITLDSIYSKPLTVSGRSAVRKTTESKFYINDKGVKMDMIELRKEAKKSYEEFSNELMATAGEKEYNAVLDKWGERYNFSKEDIYYGTMKTSAELGAAKNKLSHEMDMLMKNLFYDAVFTHNAANGSRVFISAQLKLKYDGKDKPPRFLKNDEIVLGAEFLKKNELKQGDEIMVLRDPSTMINNIRILKVIDGSKLGHTSLGKEHGCVSSIIERLVLQADQDADTMLVVKVGKGGIPLSYSEAIKARGSKIIPFTEVSASPTSLVNANSVKKVISNQLAGDDQTSMIATMSRIATSLVDNKITIEVSGKTKTEGPGKKEISKYKMFSDGVLVEEGTTSPTEVGFRTTLKYTNKEKQLIIQAIQEALDSKKSQDILLRSNDNDKYWALKQIITRRDGEMLDFPKEIGQARAVSGALKNIQRPFNIEKILKENSKLEKMIEDFEPTYKLFRNIKEVEGAALTPYQESILNLSDIKFFSVPDKARVASDYLGGLAVEKEFGAAKMKSKNSAVTKVYKAMDDAKRVYNKKDKDGKRSTREERSEAFEKVMNLYEKNKEDGKYSNQDHKDMAIYVATTPEGNVAHGRMYPKKGQKVGDYYEYWMNRYVRRFDDIINDYPKVAKSFYKGAEVKEVKEIELQIEKKIEEKYGKPKTEEEAALPEMSKGEMERMEALAEQMSTMPDDFFGSPE